MLLIGLGGRFQRGLYEFFETLLSFLFRGGLVIACMAGHFRESP